MGRITALVALLGAGCHREPAQVTGLRVVTTWTDVEVDQLEYAVADQGGHPLVAPQRRPLQAGALLRSGADLVIYFGDELGGMQVDCQVRAFHAGAVVGTAQVRQRLIARAVVPSDLVLAPGPGSKTDAAPCASGGECQSGVCSDGVCCHTACSGVCLSCDVPGQAGTCAPVPPGVKHPLCADQGAESCGFDGTCDGGGACRRYPSGTRCALGLCSGSSISAAGACDGEGHCVTGPVITCAPYGCDPSGGTPRCFSRCTTSQDCVPGRACLAGSCGTKLNGAACTAANECTSGFCVDGTCCESACAGPCVTCAQPGSLGSCRPAPAGVHDPRGVCADDGATSCRRTGLCDGNGACALYGAGTVCTPGRCLDATLLQSPARCDGAGACVSGAQITCIPYACAGGACKSSCRVTGDCAPGQVCDASQSCGKKGLGQPCTTAGECGSGFCADGVCCDQACQGACSSCALGQPPGKCQPRPAGAPDPRGICQDQGKGTCGTDGTCDGAGGCHHYPAGTVCTAGGCDPTSNVRTLPGTCAASGTCAAGATASCAPYKCNGTVCFSACSSDADCAAPSVCKGGACTDGSTGATCMGSADCTPPLSCVGSTCQLEPQGAACSSDAACSSTHCTDGVCCDTGTCPLCTRCNVSGFVGFCHPLPAGQRDARCSAQPASTCQQDGTCDGAGACRVYPAGTVCAPASCAGAILNDARTCDGAGACRSGATTDCTPFSCDPASNACFQQCTSDGQCCCGSHCAAGDQQCH